MACSVGAQQQTMSDWRPECSLWAEAAKAPGAHETGRAGPRKFGAVQRSRDITQSRQGLIQEPECDKRPAVGTAERRVDHRAAPPHLHAQRLQRCGRGARRRARQRARQQVPPRRALRARSRRSGQPRQQRNSPATRPRHAGHSGGFRGSCCSSAFVEGAAVVHERTTESTTVRCAATIRIASATGSPAAL